MKKLLALPVALIFGLALITGCGGDNGGSSVNGGGGDALAGTWTGILVMDEETDWTEDIIWVFDGKGGLKFTNGFYDAQPGTYTITGGKVELLVEGWDTPLIYSFSVNGDTLTMTADNGFSPDYDLTKN